MFALFLIMSLFFFFIDKTDISSDLTIFMTSFASLLEIINVFHFAKAEGRKTNIHGRVADPNIF